MPFFIAADVHGHPFFEVLFLLLQRPCLIWNLTAALDNALPGGPGAIRAQEFGMRSGLRFVILKVPVGGDEGLPDAVKVRMTVGHARRLVRGGLRGGGGGLGWLGR